MRQFRRTHFAAFLIICAIYVAARMWGLTASCLTFDEIFSVHAAEHGWASLWTFAALDLIHPPLFYGLLKAWTGVGGESLLWMRMLPVLFAVIAIFPFISLCNELKIPFWTRLLALFYFAVNGSLIKYSQEVRMYSILMCMSLFSMWLFARYFVKGKSLVPLIIVNVLLVWTHYFGWFTVIAEVATIVLVQQIKWRPALIMLAVTVVSFSPWIFAIFSVAGEGTGLGQNIGWMTRPGVAAIVQFKLDLIEPFYFQASNIDPISIFRVTVPLLLIITAAAVIYSAHWNDHETDEKRAVGLLLIFMIFPTLASLIPSWLLPYSIWGTRHLITVFPTVAILLAVVLAGIPKAELRTAALTLILLFTGYAFVVQAIRPAPRYIWCAWEQLAAQLPPANETKVYALEDDIVYHLWFAERNDPSVKVFKLEAGAPEDPAYFLPRGFTDVDRIGLTELGEIEFWLAYRSSDGSLPTAVSERGYIVEKNLAFSAQNTRASLVQLRKE